MNKKIKNKKKPKTTQQKKKTVCHETSVDFLGFFLSFFVVLGFELRASH
jgi:hypothetical protein